MTDATLSKDTSRFLEAEPLTIDSEISVRVDNDGPYSWIVLRDIDTNGPTFLDVSQGIALRDWLNKVLPKDACKPGEHSYQDAPICVHCGDRP